MKTMELKTSDDLQGLESTITGLSKTNPGEEITLRLARRLKMHFFKESRIAALLTTGADRGHVVIRDWHNEWKDSDASEYFRDSVVSFAAAIYATRLTNDKDSAPPFTQRTLRNNVAADGGILEPHNVATQGPEMIGKSLTFCAIDPEAIEPIALSGFLYEKNRFIDQLIALKRKYLEPYSDERDRDLAGYVFELYQNGFEHGRFSDRDEVIQGLRFISIRRHVAPNREMLLSYAGGFPELRQYLEQYTSRSKDLRFFEVSVSDQGVGILRRFLVRRPDFASAAVSRPDRLQLLKRLLLEGLTSKTDTRGAGWGLDRALRAVKALNGFLSLRTDSFWIYAAFADDQQAHLSLSEATSSSDLAPVRGTHFNALIPFRPS